MKLKQGDMGAGVLRLKCYLARLGYCEQPMGSDVYDADTAYAVSLYQHDRGLDATGEADDTTMGAIERDVLAAVGTPEGDEA